MIEEIEKILSKKQETRDWKIKKLVSLTNTLSIKLQEEQIKNALLKEANDYLESQMNETTKGHHNDEK